MSSSSWQSRRLPPTSLSANNDDRHHPMDPRAPKDPRRNLNNYTQSQQSASPPPQKDQHQPYQQHRQNQYQHPQQREPPPFHSSQPPPHVPPPDLSVPPPNLNLPLPPPPQQQQKQQAQQQLQQQAPMDPRLRAQQQQQQQQYSEQQPHSSSINGHANCLPPVPPPTLVPPPSLVPPSQPPTTQNNNPGVVQTAMTTTTTTATVSPPPVTMESSSAAATTEVVVEDISSVKKALASFTQIDEVEWANNASSNDGKTKNNNNLSGELATRPKYEYSDPCGCMPILTYNAEGESSGTPCCTDMSCVLFACLEECRSDCTAGEYCRNKRITKKQWAPLEVFDAGLKGRGLRVLQDIQPGGFITEYVGRAIKRRYLDALFRRYKNEQMLYIMALDRDTYLDARKKGSLARFINHSCEPNCVVERWKVKGVLRAGIFARREIKAGEELSFDYKWDRKRGRAPTKCHCESPSCRGTLEVARSMEEEELERKLVGHWKKPLTAKAGREIVNRSIKILSMEHQEYFPADVCRYDDTTGQHLVIYRHDLEESWEDLGNEDWMLLDEEAEQFVIAKKANKPAAISSSSSATSSSLTASALVDNATQGGTTKKEYLQQARELKNYFYVQTPIKEGLQERQFLDKVHRKFNVTINMKQCTENDASPEDSDLLEALQASKDGRVWKFTTIGFNFPKAYELLQKAVGYHQSKNEISVEPTEDVTVNSGEEVVIPRCIVDEVKRRLPHNLVRTGGNVTISLIPSASKSKQFAKLKLESELVSDLANTKESLWKVLKNLCTEFHAPLASSNTPSNSIPQDLCFYGGQLTHEQFNALYNNNSDNTSDATDRLSQSCNENLRDSPFFAAFESTQRCTVWVQAQADNGRINHNNMLISDAPTAPRKVFFGCDDPKDIPKLWGFVMTRAQELMNGVKYLHLGADKVYQQIMMQNTSVNFFDYVKKITGASVTVDSMTGNHLRIESGSSSSIAMDDDNNNGDGGAALAEEIVRLQIELYRDISIRQQPWIFGRDWSLTCGLSKYSGSSASTSALTTATDSSLSADTSPRPPSSSSSALHLSSTGTSRNSNSNVPFDSRSVANSCVEIAEITSSTESDVSVAAHATIILYRFLDTVSPNTQSKLREILLASVFLASKAQKVIRWKRLEILLEAAYKTFYPGSRFDKDGEEARIWEKKVLTAETEILITLDYDVFWKGSEWIVTTAINAGRIDESLVKKALEFAFSGPVLGAGKTLWLKYGPEYIFTAAVGFLSGNIEFLFSALSLIPLKVSQAAELIATSIKTNSSLSKKQHYSMSPEQHEILNGGENSLLNKAVHIKEVCMEKMRESLLKPSSDRESSPEHLNSEIAQRFKVTANRDRSRSVFRGVSGDLLKDVVMPISDGVSSESKCSIFIAKSSTESAVDLTDSGDITLEGSWRAIAIAEMLLREATGGKLPDPVDIPNEDDVTSRIPAKGMPGRLQMSAISTTEGWDDTNLSSLSMAPPSGGGSKTGGKSCVAGRIPESQMQRIGLRWWIPSRYGQCTSGSVCDIPGTNQPGSEGNGTLNALGNLTKGFLGEKTSSTSFPLLTSRATVHVGTTGVSAKDRNVAVSLQRWPSQKVAAREQMKSGSRKGGKSGMDIGFSPAALQELQLLMQMHSLIPSPQGHPNFMLPVAVALPSETNDIEVDSDDAGDKAGEAGNSDDDMFSLFRTSEENERAAEKEKRRKDMLSGPHLIFQPAPFVMHRFTSRSKRNKRGSDEHVLSPAIISAWFHDLLSALVHCHASNVVLRTLQPDQIIIDHSGVAKLSGMYRATVLPAGERGYMDPLKNSRSKKGEVEDVSSNPYAAPEMLLGSKKHTKETDIWALGCLMANLFLQKPLFVGKDRASLLLSIFKIVGTPSEKNYPDSLKFPKYREQRKKYKRGVEKAFQYLMKDEDAQKHSGALSLLARMLHLDPKKRITAAEALSHEYMAGYMEKSSDQSFRKQYVSEWTQLKSKLTGSDKMEEDQAKQQQKSLKRKAKFLAAASAMDNDEDDLYDMDDLLGSNSGKKLKEGV